MAKVFDVRRRSGVRPLSPPEHGEPDLLSMPVDGFHVNAPSLPRCIFCWRSDNTWCLKCWNCAKEKVFSLQARTDVRRLDHHPYAVVWVCFLTGRDPTSATSSIAGVASVHSIRLTWQVLKCFIPKPKDSRVLNRRILCAKHTHFSLGPGCLDGWYPLEASFSFSLLFFSPVSFFCLFRFFLLSGTLTLFFWLNYFTISCYSSHKKLCFWAVLGTNYQRNYSWEASSPFFFSFFPFSPSSVSYFSYRVLWIFFFWSHVFHDFSYHFHKKKNLWAVSGGRGVLLWCHFTFFILLFSFCFLLLFFYFLFFSRVLFLILFLLPGSLNLIFFVSNYFTISHYISDQKNKFLSRFGKYEHSWEASFPFSFFFVFLPVFFSRFFFLLFLFRIFLILFLLLALNFFGLKYFMISHSISQKKFLWAVSRGTKLKA